MLSSSPAELLEFTDPPMHLKKLSQVSHFENIPEMNKIKKKSIPTSLNGPILPLPI